MRSLLGPYPNATSLSRLHGRSNTVICHDTCQSSQGVSVNIVNLARVGPASYRQTDNLDKNIFCFVLHFETSSVITHCKSVTKVTMPNSLKGGHYVGKLLQGGTPPL